MCVISRSFERGEAREGTNVCVSPLGLANHETAEKATMMRRPMIKLQLQRSEKTFVSHRFLLLRSNRRRPCESGTGTCGFVRGRESRHWLGSPVCHVGGRPRVICSVKEVEDVLGGEWSWAGDAKLRGTGWRCSVGRRSSVVMQHALRAWRLTSAFRPRSALNCFGQVAVNAACSGSVCCLCHARQMGSSCSNGVITMLCPSGWV